jgi:hypothetical protein
VVHDEVTRWQDLQLKEVATELAFSVTHVVDELLVLATLALHRLSYPCMCVCVYTFIHGICVYFACVYTFIHLRYASVHICMFT